MAERENCSQYHVLVWRDDDEITPEISRFELKKDVIRFVNDTATREPRASFRVFYGRELALEPTAMVVAYDIED